MNHHYIVSSSGEISSFYLACGGLCFNVAMIVSVRWEDAYNIGQRAMFIFME